MYTLYNDDCLEAMKKLEDKSIDIILCDLPYGTTMCHWDSIIPFESLWKEYERIIKDKGCIALFGSEPFSSLLRTSNMKLYKYDWIWEKTRAFGVLHAKNRPLKIHEIISIFSKGTTNHENISTNRMIYKPQLDTKFTKINKSRRNVNVSEILHKPSKVNFDFCNTKYTIEGKYPVSILTYPMHNVGNIHPTQKPVELCEYLIKTYSNEGDLVLDNCMGSGTTGIACINTDRNFIGIEKDEIYFSKAKNRIEQHTKKKLNNLDDFFGVK